MTYIRCSDGWSHPRPGLASLSCARVKSRVSPGPASLLQFVLEVFPPVSSRHEHRLRVGAGLVERLPEQHRVEIFWPENSETSHHDGDDEDDEPVAQALLPPSALPLPGLGSVLNTGANGVAVPVSVIL